MTLLSVLDILLVIVGGAGMIYQGLCIVMSLFAKPVRFPDAPMTNRYAVLISARNEENVIGNLIGSIRDQTYPSDLIDIWLVADNCTDNTADVWPMIMRPTSCSMPITSWTSITSRK